MWVRCYTGRNFKGTVVGFVQGEAVGVFVTCILAPAIIGGAGILLWPELTLSLIHIFVPLQDLDKQDHYARTQLMTM